MSEETKDTYEMMFKPEYHGNRTISAGMYGTFKFSRQAEKIIKDEWGHKVSQELADSIATPELCTAFRDYVHTNLDFKVKTIYNEFDTHLVDTVKRKTTRLLTVQLLDPKELAKIPVEDKNLEKLAEKRLN